jgi:hypothetical protein
MASLAIGMQTAWRPDPVIDTSLDSLRAAGFEQTVHVFAEPTAQVKKRPDIELRRNAHTQGCFPNWRNTAVWMFVNTDADWIMVLQDDVVWRNDGRAQLEAGMAAHPAVGMLSPYCSPKMLPHDLRQNASPEESWQEAQFYDKTFIGALALCFPRESLGKLLHHDRFLSHTHHRKTDTLVGNTLRLELGLSILVHIPSLANHIGKWSTIGRHKIHGIQWGRVGHLFREHA